MKKLFTLFQLVYLQALIAQPSIQNPTVLPQPTSAYSLTLVTGYFNGLKSYPVSKSYTVNAAQKTMTMEACYWIPPTSLITTSIQIDTYTIGQLSPGIYTLTFNAVRSMSSTICTNYTTTSKTFTFEIFDDAVSVPRESIGPFASVYPNPVKDLLHVEMPSATAETLVLSLYNSFGEVILKDQCVIPNQAIDLSRLINGVYFLEIKCASVPKYIKVIKE